MSDKRVHLSDVDTEFSTLFTKFVFTREYTRTQPFGANVTDDLDGRAPEYLPHAKASVFADTYEIEAMRDLAMEYLDEYQKNGRLLFKGHIPLVVEMVRLAYVNEEHELGEQLREKALDYAFEHIKTLSKDDRFLELVLESRPLFNDVWDRVQADGMVKVWVKGMPGGV